jgi:hypothetical protein
MSPEQARGRRLDPRSDIFSLGIVLYEMVTGELPFSRETPLDTMHAIAFEEAKPVMALRCNLPPQVHQIISRCLRKRPEDRYPDARTLAADLKRLRHDLETGTNLTLPAGHKLRGWLESLETWIPLGNKGLIILAVVTIAAAALLFTRIQWGSLLGAALIALLIYRGVRNRKRRMLVSFTKKVSALPEVKAVVIREDEVMVILEKAPAKTYIRITSLIEAVNAKLFFGRPVKVAIKDDLAEQEFQRLLRQTGVVYVREDVQLGPPA